MNNFTRCLVILLLIPLYSSAQGTFSLITGQYHPELKWNRYETDHFLVVYNEGIEAAAVQAGMIAEQVYANLQANLGLRFPRKYPLFISDCDDIANGATSPLGYLFVWISPSAFRTRFTGTDGWLQKVLAHEMVHALVFENTRSFWDLVFPFSSLQARNHLDFYEGLAQFYGGEAWGTERGDRYLNLWIRNEDLNSSFLDLGPLVYARGFAKIRWLRQRLDDRAIGGMFQRPKGSRSFNFANAFQKVTKQSLSDFNTEWQKAMNVYYNWREGMSERTDQVGEEGDKLPCRFISVVKETPDGKKLVFTGQESDNTPDQCLFLWDRDRKTIRLLARNRIQDNFSISPDGRFIAFSRHHFDRLGSLVPDIYRVEIDSGKETRITKNLRAREPVIVDPEHLVFAGNEKGTIHLFECDALGRNVKKLTEFIGECHLYDLSASSDGRRVIGSMHRPADRKFAILIYDRGKREIHELPSASFARFPLFSPDDRGDILYTGQTGDTLNVFRRSTGLDSEIEVTRQSNTILITQWPKREKALGISQVSRDRNRLITLDPFRTPERFPGDLQPYYRTWTDAAPGVPMAIDLGKKPEGAFIGRFHPWSTFRLLQLSPVPLVLQNHVVPALYGIAADMMGKHFLTGAVALNLRRPSQTNVFLEYLDRATPLAIQADAGLQDSVTFGYRGKQHLYEGIAFAGLDLSRSWEGKSDYDQWRGSLEFLAEESRLRTGIDPASEADSDLPAYPGIPEPYRLGRISLTAAWTRIQPFTFFPTRGTGLQARYGYTHSLDRGGFAYHSLHLQAVCIRPLFQAITGCLFLGFQGNHGRYPPQKEVGMARFQTFHILDHYSEDIYVRTGDRYYPGNRLLTATAEVRIPINPLNFAFFIDGAHIWGNEKIAGEKGITVFSGGLELQAPLPIGKTGMISLGVARRIFSREESKWQVYLSLKRIFWK